MINIIKNNKWVITTSLICIIFGVLTFFTFINQSFISLNEFNLQILLFVDAILLILFFTLIIRETYKILKDRSKKKLGSETALRYIIFFSTTTLLPSILIAIFSLVLFNVGVQKFFNKKADSSDDSDGSISSDDEEEVSRDIIYKWYSYMH